MEKEKKILMMCPKLELSFFTLIILILFSCNNNKADKKAELIKDTTKTGSLTGPHTTSFNGNFPILSIPKTELDDYFDPPPHQNLHKIVFRFRFEDENALPSLVMYGATSMSVFQPPATPLGVVNPTPISISVNGEFFLGNLELTRIGYNRLRAGAGTNPDLLFYPKVSTTYPNQVTYQLIWGTTLHSLSDTTTVHLLPPPPPPTDELNPSPPAPPGS